MTDKLTHGRNCAGLIPGEEGDCTCGLQWRIDLQTEQKLHNAWRKRAEKAELQIADLQAQLARFDEDSKVACERCQKIKICVSVETGFAGEHEPLCGECISATMDEMEKELSRALAEQIRKARLDQMERLAWKMNNGAASWEDAMSSEIAGLSREP